MAIKSFHFQQIAAKVLFKITNKGVERDPIDCPVYFLLRKGSLSYPINTSLANRGHCPVLGSHLLREAPPGLPHRRGVCTPSAHVTLLSETLSGLSCP